MWPPVPPPARTTERTCPIRLSLHAPSGPRADRSRGNVLPAVRAPTGIMPARGGSPSGAPPAARSIRLQSDAIAAATCARTAGIGSVGVLLGSAGTAGRRVEVGRAALAGVRRLAGQR